MLTSFGEDTVFTFLDCSFGYFQISLAADETWPTTFKRQAGAKYFCRMPFGHINAHAAFQRILNRLLAGYGLRISRN